MAQLVPALTSLPLDSTAAPSVEDIQARQPSICVDYLSHDWEEEDVWASWRSMTRHKNEIANGVRLENASWRTWQKQRNKLRTISPETLNWLKDSDVTWLYGPLHTAAVEPVRPLKISSTDDRLGIVRADSGSGKKPILKHRTLSEMLTIPMPSSPILESSYTNGDANVPDLDNDGRPTLMQTKSDTNIVRRNVTSGRKGSPDRSVISSGGRSPANEPAIPSTSSGFQPAQGVSTPDTDSGNSGKRHISFNTFVEQCISVDEPERQESDSDSDDSGSDVLEMRSNSSSRSSRPSFSRNSSTSSAEHLTIAKIAPTTLKTTGVFPSPSPAVVFAPPPEYQSPGASSSSSTGSVRGAVNNSYDFPSPQQSRGGKWDNDEGADYGSVGFDYFSGPDLGVGSEYDKQKGATAVQSHVGSTGYASGPPKGPPGSSLQAQVQAAKGNASPQNNRSSPQSSSNSSANTSQDSSASATPVQTPAAISTSPRSSISGQGNATQPGRSILKVRPPGHSPRVPEPDTDPSSYFNFNPSVATGFGMNQPRGSVASSLPSTAATMGPTGSPITSPVLSSSLGTDGQSERGRSSVRQGSSASLERSGSRSTTGTVASVSPNAASRPTSIPHPHPPQTDPSAGTIPAAPAGAAPFVSSGLAAGGTVKGQKPPAIKTPSDLGGDHSSADSGGQSPGRSPWSDGPNGDASEPMNVSSSDPDYIPERSSTPTPHSSPQQQRS